MGSVTEFKTGTALRDTANRPPSHGDSHESPHGVAQATERVGDSTRRRVTGESETRFRAPRVELQPELPPHLGATENPMGVGARRALKPIGEATEGATELAVAQSDEARATAEWIARGQVSASTRPIPTDQGVVTHHEAEGLAVGLEQERAEESETVEEDLQ